MDPERTAEKLKQQLKEKAKRLTPEEKKLARQQLVANTKAAKSHGREKDEEKETKPAKVSTPSELARQRALDLRERVNFLGEKDGAYGPAWTKYFMKDGSATNKHMDDLAQHLDIAGGLADKVLFYPEVPADLIVQLDHTIDVFSNQVMPLVNQIDAAMRDADAASKPQDGPEELGDAIQVLDGLEALCDPNQWAIDIVNADKAKGKVIGSNATIELIGGCISKYVVLWDSLGTDGLKGATYKGLKQLADCRMDIVNAVASSGDPFLMACCRPGTLFYGYIQSIAKQSCSSRDVQVFGGWWAKNGMGTG